MSFEPRQLFNFIQGSDISGESSYDIWKSLYPESTQEDFLEYLKSGPQGEKGENGEPASYFALSVSDTVMKRGLNNILLPENITFTSFYRIGTNVTRYDYAGRFIIQETTDGISWETKYTSEVDEVSKTYAPSSLDVKIIKCTLYSAGGTTVELDTQSVAILTDVENLEVGTRNLLSGSDIHYELSKDTANVSSSISIVNGFDLQRLIGKKLTLSYYADTIGDYTSGNKFGISSELVWSDSTGANTENTVIRPFDTNSVGISKNRVNFIYDVQAPEGYDTIDSFIFNIDLSIKPDTTNENIWVFERPKLEIGNVATEWSPAPEDIETLVAILNNEAHTIATDGRGTGGNFDDCNSSIQVYNGTRDVTSEATYEVTVSEGITGSWDLTTYTYKVTDLSVDNGYVDIIASYKGISVTKRFTVTKSKSGKSAYEIWLDIEGNEGKSEQEFLESLKISSSNYDFWLDLGNKGTPEDYMNQLKGSDGKSAYQLWLDAGNTGTEEEFIQSLASNNNYVECNEYNSAYIVNLTEPFTLTQGSRVFVKFTESVLSVIYAYPKLNVNNTGAISIIQGDGKLVVGMNVYLQPNFIYEFVYDGTNWVILNATQPLVNHLNMDTSLEGYALDARQGTALKGLIDDVNSAIGSKLETTGDSKDNTVTFSSSDSTTATAWTDTEVLASGEKHSSLFAKISTMFKNIRYLYNTLTTLDTNLGKLTWAADATNTATNSWTDNASITLAPGKYILFGTTTIAGQGKVVTIRILSGTTSMTRQSVYAADNNQYTAHVNEFVNLTTETVVKLQSWSSNATELINTNFKAVRIK